MFQRLTTFLLIFALANFPLFGQTTTEKIDAEINRKIRAEAEKNSRIMRTVHVLSDVYGPRMTGTPQLKAAQEWALKELQSYGLQNAHLEAWDFGFPGWQNEQLTARVVAPYTDSLVGEAMAWTPGTNGLIRAVAFNLIPPDAPTDGELDAYLASVEKQIRGKIVLTGKHTVPPINFKPPTLRLSDDEARAIYEPRIKPNATNQNSANAPSAQTAIKKLTPLEVNDRIDRFLKTGGALARFYDAREPHGVVRAVINRTRDVSAFLPTVVLRNEDYGRIARVLVSDAAAPVEIELNVVNRLFPEGRTAYNALAEIVGGDKRDELVMLGAHIDAHHLATGATDNAVGCAIMIEAVRILQALNVKPRRTIRIALWSGEEQRVLGSQEYVRKHFGSVENPRPAFDKFAGYFNLDTGTGRIRGMRVFGPDAAGASLRQIIAPFADLGVVGAGTYSNRTAPGSDHAAFSVNGLPGIYIDQDPLEHGSLSWHTNLDTYERVVETDARQAAVVIASAVYHLAMREEKLPRFSREQTPPLQYQPTPAKNE